MPDSAGNFIGSAANPIDPRLAPLADNGGPTPTHALFPDSPALDNGDPALAGTLDQRGELRDATPDIGAFEALAETISIDDVTVTEGDAGGQLAFITVRLSSPVTETVSVDYTTLPETAQVGSDFLDRFGTVTFAPGQTTRQIVVPVLGDTEVEGDETFRVHLFNPSGRSIADAVGEATIIDNDVDDVFAPLADAGGPYEVNEGGAVQLDAFATTDFDQDPQTLTYEWDLDGDGVFGETGASATRGDEIGINPTFLPTGLNGGEEATLELRVTDDDGLTDTAQAVITVNDVDDGSDTAAVFGDFGALGLWRRTDAGGWEKLSNGNAETMVTAPNGDLFAEFGGSGLWLWSETDGWRRISLGNAERLTVDGNGDLFADFGAIGLWRWNADGGWLRLSLSNAENVIATSDGILYADFGPLGFWQWQANNWTRLTVGDAENMAVGKNGELSVNFGVFGLWRHTNSGFEQLSSGNAQSIVVGSNGELFAVFTFGTWRWTESTGWSRLSTANADRLAAGANGDLFANFSFGLWRWTEAAGWEQLSASSAERLTVSPDGDLYADLGALGLWRWTLATAWSRLSLENADEIATAW